MELCSWWTYTALPAEGCTRPPPAPGSCIHPPLQQQLQPLPQQLRQTLNSYQSLIRH